MRGCSDKCLFQDFAFIDSIAILTTGLLSITKTVILYHGLGCKNCLVLDNMKNLTRSSSPGGNSLVIINYLVPCSIECERKTELSAKQPTQRWPTICMWWWSAVVLFNCCGHAQYYPEMQKNTFISLFFPLFLLVFA